MQGSASNSALVEAARWGRLVDIERALKAGADVNAADQVIR